MELVRVWEHIPEILVALSYYPCGAFLAFILHSYMTIENTLREYSFIWALCFGILGALFATLVLTISKAVAKRIVWLHYYVLAVGSALLLVAGIVCTQNYGNWGFEVTTVCGGIGYGIIYISGMAYIHVRSNSRRHRVARIALCHLALFIGIVTTASYIGYRARWVWARWYYNELGWFMLYSGASVLACFLLNELLHGLGAYNYKKCLTVELEQASKQRDRMKSALTANPIRRKNKSRQFELVMLTVLSKSLNGFFHNNVFLLLAIVAQGSIINNYGAGIMTPHYFAISGVFLGMVISLSARIRVMYPVVLLGQLVSLTVAAILWSTHYYVPSGVFFWLFYLFGGAGLFLPDVGMMEVAHPMYYEISMFVGFVLEQIPMVVAIYFVREEMMWTVYAAGPLWYNVGFTLGIGSIVMLWWGIRYPNTYRLKVLEIQRLILYNHTGPWIRPAAAGHHTQPMGAAPAEVIQQMPQPMMVQPTYPAPMSLPPTGPSQPPYLVAQPLYPGHQPVYMVHPAFYPAGPSGQAPGQLPPFAAQPIHMMKAGEASAPDISEETQMQWALQQSVEPHPPPSYGEARERM